MGVALLSCQVQKVGTVFCMPGSGELTLGGQLHVCSIMFKDNYFLQEPVINSLSEQNFRVASNIYRRTRRNRPGRGPT